MGSRPFATVNLNDANLSVNNPAADQHRRTKTKGIPAKRSTAQERQSPMPTFKGREWLAATAQTERFPVDFAEKELSGSWATTAGRTPLK